MSNSIAFGVGSFWDASERYCSERSRTGGILQTERRDVMLANGVDLFGELSPEAKSEISSLEVEQKYEKGCVLFRRGDQARHLFVLVEGTVRLEMGRDSIRDYLIMNPGDTFGWSSLVESDVYPATAQCLVPTRLIKIESPRMSAVFERHPLSGVAFFRQLAGALENSLLEMHRAKH